jgi:hypothetical protein
MKTQPVQLDKVQHPAIVRIQEGQLNRTGMLVLAELELHLHLGVARHLQGDVEVDACLVLRSELVLDHCLATELTSWLGLGLGGRQVLFLD